MAVTAVASTTTSTQLLPVNSGRKVLIIENSDANALYVLLDGGTASASNKSFTLAQDANARIEGYGGEVTGVWAGDGSGSAHITHWP